MQNIEQLSSELLKPNKDKTYNSNIFIPLFENFLGSFSLGALPFVLYFLIIICITTTIPPISQTVVILWILISLLIFTAITAFVFLSDDLKIKILYSAFQLGYNLALDKNIIISSVANEPKAVPSNNVDVQLIETCLIIVQMFFANKKISQRECEKNNITRNQWEAATKLMANIGLLQINDKKTSITEPSFDTAKTKLVRHFSK